jgi:hypothetical protein
MQPFLTLPLPENPNTSSDSEASNDDHPFSYSMNRTILEEISKTNQIFLCQGWTKKRIEIDERGPASRYMANP